MVYVEGLWKPTLTEDGIFGFFKEYAFLSNMYPCRILIDGMSFNSSEHAYMSLKTENPEEKLALSTMGNLTSHQAKKYGKTVTIREDWDVVRVPCMERVLMAKFVQNPGLLNRLLLTDNKTLEETNYWKDTFWGVYKGAGENNLGKALMKTRDIIRKELSD